MMIERNDFLVLNTKALRHPNNKKFVTARVNIINHKKVLNFSIGIDICKAVNFKANDRIHVMINKENRNFLIFKKSLSSFDGYKLYFNEKGNSSFLTFAIRYEAPETFKLSQTTILDFDYKPDILLINLEKLKND